MGHPDDEKGFPEKAEISMGGGKDLLYGWLVGRAAADLGLAQALATSEAQRSEQIKRLEESLLGQIRALQNNAVGATAGGAEFDALKVELQRVSESQQQLAVEHSQIEQLEAAIRGKLQQFESHIQAQSQSGGELGEVKFELKLLVDRVVRAEHAVQQTQGRAANQQQQLEAIVADRLAAETARLKSQLVTELPHPTAAEAISQSLEAGLRKQFDELGAELRREAGAANQVTEVRDRLEQLFARMDRLEAAPSAAAILAEQENRWRLELDERLARLEPAAPGGAAELRAEIGAIEARLDAVAQAAQADALARKQVSESFADRLNSLQEKLNAALDAMERRDAESVGLNGQLNMVGDQLAQLSGCWQAHAVRTDSLESRLNHGFEAAARQGAEMDQWRIDLSALVNRLTQLELSCQQVQSMGGSWVESAERLVEGLRSELGALKAELGQQAITAAQSVLAGVEAGLGAKLDEIERQLLGAQDADQGRDRRLSDMRGELQLIAQRVIQVESSGQQSHALALNEAAQAAQSRDSLMGEIAALQGRFADQLASRANVERLAQELSARVDELQNQLGRSMALFESRGAEIAELKMQVQKLSPLAVVKSTAAPNSVSRPQEPIGVTGGLGGTRAQTGTMIPVLTSTAAESNTLLQSYDAEGGASNEQKKQLQRRISADIERVRAELRKRAGVNR